MSTLVWSPYAFKVTLKTECLLVYTRKPRVNGLGFRLENRVVTKGSIVPIIDTALNFQGFFGCF